MEQNQVTEKPVYDVHVGNESDEARRVRLVRKCATQHRTWIEASAHACNQVLSRCVVLQSEVFAEDENFEKNQYERTYQASAGVPEAHNKCWYVL